MGRYANVNGVLTPIAGRGKAEYGASTLRKGTLTVPVNQATGGIFIEFDTPLPDNDYIVSWEFDDCADGDAAHIVGPHYKYTTGFGLYYFGGFSKDVIIRWTAFKLYTDNQYNELLTLPTEVSRVDHLYDHSGEIVSNDDLNDFVVPGNYVAGTAAIALSLLNKPADLSYGFSLKVEVRGDWNESGTHTLFQTIYKTNANADTAPPQESYIYYRSKGHNINVWNPWRKVATDKDIVSLGIVNEETGCKNILVWDRGRKETLAGVTFTYDFDTGICTANGLATERINYTIMSGIRMRNYPTGDYWYSGCPEEDSDGVKASTNTFFCYTHPGMNDGGASWKPAVFDFGKGAKFHYDNVGNNVDGNTFTSITIIEGYECKNLQFKMMITSADDPDPLKFVPPALSNRIISGYIDRGFNVENGEYAISGYAVGRKFMRGNNVCSVIRTITAGDALLSAAEDSDNYNYCLREVTEIVPNTNLNTLIYNGEYYCGSSAAAQSCTNRPTEVNQGFRMRVIDGAGEKGEGWLEQCTMQIIEFVNNGNVPAMYMRLKQYNGSFGNWYKFSGTQVASS